MPGAGVRVPTAWAGAASEPAGAEPTIQDHAHDARTAGGTVRGSARTVGLVELLTVIHGNGHAGTLKLQIGERSTRLHFWKGQIYLPVGGSRGSYRLGALLVRAGKLNGRDLLRALHTQKTEGHRERLGDLLVRLKLVTREDLDRVIRTQFEEEICDLLFEEGADFEFKKDVLPAGFADKRGNILALGFDTRSILMEASRRQDEWRRIHSLIPSPRSVYRPMVLPTGAWHVDGAGKVKDVAAENAPDPNQRALEVWKGVDALFEENPFDGIRTVEEVVAASGVSAFVAMGAIAQMRQEGLLQPIGASELEASVLKYLRDERNRHLAYRLYGWANESERLRGTASRLDKVLLRNEYLQGQGFSARTTSERALQVLSRLLRRGTPFRYLAREGESVVEVFYSTNYLRLHLVGPRRTHSTTRYLRRRKALSSAALEQARELARMQGRRLDELLLEEGFVDREQWVRAVKDKVVSGMFSVFGWSEPHLEVQGGVCTPPPPEEVTDGLICEIPFDGRLRESLRRDLLRWKVLLKEIPSPDVMFVVTAATPRDRPRRASDLFDGRRSVADLIRLARVAPLELVRFIWDCVRTRRIRRLSDREHYERLNAAVSEGRPEDAIAYCKSAIAFGHAPTLYGQRLEELRRRLQDRPSKTEGMQVLEGDIQGLSLAEVLQLLHQGRRSGTLRITEGEQEKVYYLEQGTLCVLKVEESESSQEVWDLLMESQTRTGIDLEGLLKRRGFLTENEVGADELLRIKEEIFSTFLWEEARFEFTQNLLPTELRQDTGRATKLALATDRLLLQAMPVLSEWDELRQKIRATRAVWRWANSVVQQQAAQGALGPVASLIDGKRTIEDVLRVAGGSRLRLLRAIGEQVSQKALVYLGIKQPEPTKLRREPLASGRVPRLGITPAEPTDSESSSGEVTGGKPRTASQQRKYAVPPAVETEDEIDLSGLGDSFAEEGLEESD